MEKSAIEMKSDDLEPDIELFFAKKMISDGIEMKNTIIEVKNGYISKITCDSEAMDGMIISDIIIPGFIDIHNHGCGGSSRVLTYWESDYTAKKLPMYGTTTVLASVTFPQSDIELTESILRTIDKKVDVVVEGQCVIGGIHAEGPIIATCSGLPESENDMSREKFELLLDNIPSLKVMTISPSLEAKSSYQKIRLLVKRGVRPAIGHDANATEEDILGAIRSVPDVQLHITHLFNVCSFHHRNVSLVNFGLMRRLPKFYGDLISPTVEVIGDYVHVHPTTIQLAIDCRSDQISVITDAIIDPEETKIIEYCGRDIQITKANDRSTVTLKGSKTIAGSCGNQLSMFQDFARDLDVSLPNLVSMFTCIPARIAYLQCVGSIKVGYRADLLLLKNDLKLESTYINGKKCYPK